MRYFFLSFFVFVLLLSDNGSLNNYLFALDSTNDAVKENSTLDEDALATQAVEKNRINKSNTQVGDFDKTVGVETHQNKNKPAQPKTIAQYREDILFNNKIKPTEKVAIAQEDEAKPKKKLPYPIIDEFNFNAQDGGESAFKQIKNKDPLFFISKGQDSLLTEYSNHLCSLINNQNAKYNCLVYPIAKKNDFASYMKKGIHSDKFETTGVSGDFIILREDEYIKYETQSKKDKTLPKLDLIMFLNGEYMFMFANKMTNVFSIEQLVVNKASTSNLITVGFINKRAANTFKKVIAPLFPSVKFNYKTLEPDFYQENFCQPNDIDIFVSVGENFPLEAKKAIDSCVAQLSPVTFSNKTLAKITKKYPFFSIANIADYYQSSSMLNYIETYIALELAYEAKLQIEAEKNKKINAKITKSAFKQDTDIVPVINVKQERAKSIDSDPNSGRIVLQLPPVDDKTLLAKIAENKAQKLKAEAEAKKPKAEVEAKAKKAKAEADLKKQSSARAMGSTAPTKKNQNYYMGNNLIIREESLQYVRGKSNNNRISSQVQNYKAIMNARSKSKHAYNMSNLSIKTFGVRYVLVASRYARKDAILVTFDSIIKNYFLHKSYILTPDMDKFSISDLILGTSAYTNFRYHPFLLDYPTYILESSQQKSPEQVIALKLLNNQAVTTHVPPFFGPKFPNQKELNTVFLRMRTLNKQKKDLITLRIFQRDMRNIQKALTSISQGKAIEDSVLKATGLDKVSVIYDDKSVIYQNSDELFNAQVGNVSGEAKGNNKTTLENISNTTDKKATKKDKSKTDKQKVEKSTIAPVKVIPIKASRIKSTQAKPIVVTPTTKEDELK